jgi:plasmid maintenance system antidote protein VapI
LRLAKFLKTPPQLWMRVQADWDRQQAMRRAARRAS